MRALVALCVLAVSASCTRPAAPPEEPAAPTAANGDPCAFGGLPMYPPARPSTPEGRRSAPARTVASLKTTWPAVGTRVDVIGHVAKIYECPPCPEGAECKPCMGDNIILSDTKKALAQYTLAADDVVVFMGNPHQLKLGDRRRFTVQVCPQHTSDTTPTDLAVVAYERTAESN